MGVPSKSSSSPRIGVVGIPGKWSSETLADALHERTGFRMLIDLSRVSVDLHRGTAIYEGNDIAKLDGLVIKKVDQVYSANMLDRIELLRFLESLGVRCFSPAESILRLVDRLACTVTLRAAGIPMPATIITEDVAYAAAAINEFGGAVLKPLYSTKARGMEAIDPGPEAEVREKVQAFKADGNPVMYVQRKIKLPDRDLGVVFLGGEYLTTYARVSGEGAWNTTTQAGGHYEAHTPSDEVIEIARRAQALFNLDFTAVDVVETDEGIQVFEVSAFGGFRGLRDACNIDAAARLAEHAIARVLND